MTDRKPRNGPGWDRIQGLVPAVEGLRELRYEPDSLFDDVPDAALAQATRWLRASSYSAAEGARKLDRILRARHLDEPDFDPDKITTKPTRKDHETP